MKKLFTLMMVLAVASVGYSQVKQVSKNDARAKAQQMRKAARIESYESLQNVQSESNIVRMDGIEGEAVQLSTYDWQSNDGPRTWTKVWDDGTVNFAFTVANETDFADRGTGLIKYDANSGEWSTIGGRIENEKTGFGTIAQYGENGLVVAAHTSTECLIFIAEDKDNIAANSVPRKLALDPTNDPCWPNVMTSGPNRDIIHVVATASGNVMPEMVNVTDPVIYFRSSDGGLTWDKQNVVLPYMGPEDAIDWTSNCCYWMETTEDNCLALVINNAWSDGFVLYSYDDGETWNKKPFYYNGSKFTGVNADSAWFWYPRWTSAVWSNDGKLKLAYEIMATTGEPGSGSYYPQLGGVAYWGEDMRYHSDSLPEFGFDPNNPQPPVIGGAGFVMDSAYIANDIYASWPFFSDGTHYYGMLPEYIGYCSTLDENGFWENPYEATEFNLVSSDERALHGHYNNGISAFPVLCKVPGSDDLVAVWSTLDENCKDGSGNYFFHLFARYSCDGGESWTDMLNLTAGEADYWIYSQAEMVYPQAAIIGNELIIAVQQDEEIGPFVQSEDLDPMNNYYTGYVYNLNDLFGPNVSVPEVSHNTKMIVSPNPASTMLNVNLNQDSEIVIYTITGQVVSSVKGHVGPNTINVSSLSSGVYFINAGSDTQKFVVK